MLCYEWCFYVGEMVIGNGNVVNFVIFNIVVIGLVDFVCYWNWFIWKCLFLVLKSLILFRSGNWFVVRR